MASASMPESRIRSLEIPDKNQQERGVEEQGRDRKWKMFDAALGQRDGADHGRKEQGQNHERGCSRCLISSLRQMQQGCKGSREQATAKLDGGAVLQERI